MRKIKNLIFSLIVSMMILMTSCISDGSEATCDQTDSTAVFNTEITVDTVETVDTLVQCYAITKDGTRCERLVNSPDTLCFQHKK